MDGEKIDSIHYTNNMCQEHIIPTEHSEKHSNVIQFSEQVALLGTSVVFVLEITCKADCLDRSVCPHLLTW